jgi:hypothetical protein
MANLDDAARAFRAAVAAVEATKAANEQRLRAAREKAEAARVALAAAMVEAAKEGRRQTEIIAVSGYSREHVRTILRQGGVESDR